MYYSMVGPQSNISPGSLSPTLTPPLSSNQQTIMKPLAVHSQPAATPQSQVPAQPPVAGGGGGSRPAIPSQVQVAGVSQAQNTAAPRTQSVAVPRPQVVAASRAQTVAAAAPRPQVVATSHAQTVAATPSHA